MATLASLRSDTVDYIRFRLGDGMVDVELDPEHYDNAIDKAVKRFRQRSQNAYESSYVFLECMQNGMRKCREFIEIWTVGILINGWCPTLWEGSPTTTWTK